MNCYECVKNDTKSAAVAICRCCGAGLCLRHLRETASESGPGGMNFYCRHDTWKPGASSAKDV